MLVNRIIHGVITLALLASYVYTKDEWLLAALVSYGLGGAVQYGGNKLEVTKD